MKYLKLLPILLLFACNKGLQKSDKAYIQFSIDLHNTLNKATFAQDSITEAYKLKAKYYNLPKRNVDETIADHMPVFSNEWNKPYDIKKDRFLNMESYLQYCKSYNYDPKEFASTLAK